jgi:hypothetical protein
MIFFVQAFSFVFLGMELGVNQAPNNDFKSQKEEPKRFLNRTRSRRSASTGTPAVAVPPQKPRRRTSVTNDSNGTQNISYLEAQTSQEGPPSQRFCFRLQWKVSETPPASSVCSDRAYADYQQRVRGGRVETYPPVSFEGC